MNEIIDRINRIAAFLLALAATCGCAQEPRPCREIKFSALPQGTMLYADHVNLSSNGEPFAKDDAYSLSCLKVEFVDAADGTSVQRNVPALMKTFGGADVKSVADWENIRRPELLARFEKEVFGVRPKAADERHRVSFRTLWTRDALDGKSVKKLVAVDFDGPKGKFSFPFTAYLPKTQTPVPAFVHIALRKMPVEADGEVVPGDNWPVDDIVGRGFATASFVVTNIAQDAFVGFSKGVFAAVEDEAERTPESWATLSAWAWGASRVLDWMATEPSIDEKRVAVVGHSRGGKTALWAGATDGRFAMACSNGSGCTGAKLNHMDIPKSESIKQVLRFRHWFCRNYDKYAGKEMEMDFDQHELLALVAPRLMCIGSGSQDRWAGPPGEWASARLASPAWELYGKKGLVATSMPALGGSQQDGSVAYHLHDGPHNLGRFDWARYMDFMEKRMP